MSASRLLTALALLVSAAGPALAEVPMSGTFTASKDCGAFQSFRNQTNPGDVKIAPGTVYTLLSKNKEEATRYRILVPGATPPERWVETTCGSIEEGATPPGQPATSAEHGARATHVLSLSWEPQFCAKLPDKPECGHLSAASYGATHLSLHGLWPQPRNKQYCNVSSAMAEADKRHDWQSLPEPEISPETMKRLAAVMPGVESVLQRHEWIKHGTCYGASADSYFDRAAALAEAVNGSKVAQAFAGAAGGTLTATGIRAAFDEAFGAGAGNRVTVSCTPGQNAKITEIIINLAGDVRGTAPLSDLMHAAEPVKPGCPVGFVTAAPSH